MDKVVIKMEEYLAHKVSEVICVKCGHRWISARPATTMLKSLECPECKQVGFTIETGEVLEG